MQTKTKLIAALLALSVSGVTLLTTHEGKVNRAYLDPVGIPTVCVGHTGPDVKLGKTYSDEVCVELLNKDTAVAQRAVGRLVAVPVTQEQYDAVVSFTFNVGEGNLANSTLLKKINAGDCTGAGAEFLRWNRAKGKVLPGLTKRRNAEASQWLSGC